MSLHDGRPHLRYSATGADPAAHIRAITAAGLVYVICSADAEQLGRCARPDCALAFVGTSRNGRCAYCSVRRCANNDAVARHRERRHGSPTPIARRTTPRTQHAQDHSRQVTPSATRHHRPSAIAPVHLQQPMNGTAALSGTPPQIMRIGEGFLTRGRSLPAGSRSPL
ncbi:CGNR zinc finger domain-containing protein [Streptomyces sp. NPDC056323]|uniref:CGNR zinc finger domain-containing protein n=1 Tax=Streptomyces sp. NPDC056323 TaxID=3345784 RepID=UPI0035E32E4C